MSATLVAPVYCPGCSEPAIVETAAGPYERGYGLCRSCGQPFSLTSGGHPYRHKVRLSEEDVRALAPEGGPPRRGARAVAAASPRYYRASFPACPECDEVFAS